MKNNNILILILCVLFTSCNNTDDIIEPNIDSTFSLEKKQSPPQWEKPIFAAHRCNSFEKLKEVVDEGVYRYEVDIHVGERNNMPTLLIGHESATATGKTFEEYVDYLMTIQPQFDFLWLDFKDLNSNNNEAIIKAALEKLDSKYNIKGRVLIESRYPKYLKVFVDAGWETSYYIAWEKFYGKSEIEQAEVAKEFLEELNMYGINGMSYDAQVNDAVVKYFSDITINNKELYLYTWDLRIRYGTSDFEKAAEKYSALTVVLFHFPSNNNV